MDGTLQHDPRTKQQIKDVIYDFLYRPALKQFRSRLDAIIVKNCTLQGNDNASFYYKGVLYLATDVHPPVKRQRLASQLAVYMDQYLLELDQLNNYELPYVLGFIGQVLNSSSDLHDYLRVFPDAIHRPINNLIANCPCRTSKLTPDSVLDLQIRNQASINLMKQRLVMNLLT